MERNLVELYQTFQFRNPSLVVCWQTRDVGNLSSKVIQFLNEKLRGQKIAEIKPSGFFPLGGISFKDNLIQTPESEFWACEKGDLLVFKSGEPDYGWYEFLNAILDFAQHYCQAKAITVSI